MSRSGGDNERNTIPISNFHLDSEIYRAISIQSYSNGIPLETLINNMLKNQLAMQGFLKNGFELFHKDIVRTLANAIPDEKLVQDARNFPTLPKEMVILNVDGTKPDLKKYIKSFTSFMTVNGYPVVINEDEKAGTITFFAKPNINRKYSLFWSEIIKMTLENLAEITKVEITDTSVFIECKRI